MLYAILCYNDERAVGAWSKAEDDAVMGRLSAVEATLTAQKRLGPVARLLPTTAATSLRKGKATEEHLVLDGPYAETKEQLLGFYVVECAGLEAALQVARDLAIANPRGGGYEVRPLAVFRGGDAGRSIAAAGGVIHDRGGHDVEKPR